MNFGRAFTYVFEDPDWIKKVGIAALVILIPIVGAIILLGWGLELTRRVIQGDAYPLPDWTDFGGFVAQGFKAFVVALAYTLPVILIVICGQAISFGLIGAAGGAMDSNNSDMMGTVLMLAMSCIYCFAFIFGILAGLMIPPAMGTLAATNDLGAAFRFGEVLGMLRSAIGPYVLTLVLVGLTSMILTPIGSLACGFGALATAAYTNAVSAHLYGQAYTVAKAAQANSPVSM